VSPPTAGSPRAEVDPLELLTAYQHSAIVAAAVRTGVADALAEGPADAATVAAAKGLNERAVRMLLGAMAALGLAVHDAGDRFRLSDSGAELARAHPRSIASIVEKEWFFYRVWAGLDDAIVDGHARIGPWRERLEADPAQSRSFLLALDDLAARFGGELPGLAGADAAGRVLDVGGGAGSHAAALAAGGDGVEVTVLDLPAVEPILRERHPELRFVAGDLEAPRFGRPEGERWDTILLANILHDHSPERAGAIVAQAAGLLAPGGSLLLYEWVLNDDRDTPSAVALFALMMLVENEGGAAYTETELRGWLAAAGLDDVQVRRGGGPIAVVSGRSRS